MSREKELVKQDQAVEAPEVPEEEQAPATAETSTSIDDKLNEIYKALADLQAAVKDLATALSASAEVQRGLSETLNEVKGKVEELEKAVTVGTSAVARENIAEEKKKPTAPKPAEGAESVNVPPKEMKEPAEHLYEKGDIVDVKKNEAVTPRPDVGVTTVGEDKEFKDVVKGILSGEIKPGQALDLVREVIKA